MEGIVNLYHMLTFELEPEDQWFQAGCLQCYLDSIPLQGERYVYRQIQIKIYEMNCLLDVEEESKPKIQFDETKNVVHEIPSR